MLYSRPLSPGAKEKLVDFLEAYLESLRVAAEVDTKAEIAKQKAIACLQTDIDILVFVNTLWIMPQATSLIQQVMDERMPSRKIAEQLVGISEKAHSIDRAQRPGGKA